MSASCNTCFRLLYTALLTTAAMSMPLTAAALTPAPPAFSEGGPIISTYPFPCMNPFGWWTIKLTNSPVPVAIPVIYPYLPGVVTKTDFLPATPGTSTVGNALPAGLCVTVPHIPCGFGLCPAFLPGATSVVHGIAVQPF